MKKEPLPLRGVPGEYKGGREETPRRGWKWVGYLPWGHAPSKVCEVAFARKGAGLTPAALTARNP